MNMFLSKIINASWHPMPLSKNWESVKLWDPRDLEFDEKNNTNPMNLQVNKEERAREEFTPQEWMYSQ